MKQIPNILQISTILLIINILISCSNDNSCDPIYAIQDGVTGVVSDTAGNSLQNVEVFCLYYKQYIQKENTPNTLFMKPFGVDTFAFILEQNFPNPFSNSTFIRFALPQKSIVSLTITDKISGTNVYQLKDSLSPGYYQKYLNDIVDSLQIQNGAYQYNLYAVGDNGKEFSEKQELFVISDLGTPNSLSNNEGRYTVEFQRAFVGDSIFVQTTDNYSDLIRLTNTINLLFKKDGFQSKVITASVYSNVLIQRDVIMIKENL